MYVRNGYLSSSADSNSKDEIFELEDGDIGIIIIDRRYRLPGDEIVQCVKFKYDNESPMFYTSNGRSIPAFAAFRYIRLQQAFQDLINAYGNFE